MALISRRVCLVPKRSILEDMSYNKRGIYLIKNWLLVFLVIDALDDGQGGDDIFFFKTHQNNPFCVSA